MFFSISRARFSVKGLNVVVMLEDRGNQVVSCMG